MDELKDLFLQDKPAGILVEIKRGRGEIYASILSKEVDCTYSHAVKILKKFEQNNLVEFDKNGRKKLIELTDEGEKIASTLDELIREINSVK